MWLWPRKEEAREERENGVAARVRCVAAAEGAGRAKERQNTGWYAVIIVSMRRKRLVILPGALEHAQMRFKRSYIAAGRNAARIADNGLVQGAHVSLNAPPTVGKGGAFDVNW